MVKKPKTIPKTNQKYIPPVVPAPPKRKTPAKQPKICHVTFSFASNMLQFL